MVSFEENDCSESQATFVIEDEELNYVEGAWIQNMWLKRKKMKKSTVLWEYIAKYHLFI